MSSFKELTVYRKAYELAMIIFQKTKVFPSEERYSLIDQIRRSSRSVCANIAESYRRRLYPAHFIAKISDADMENSETSVWIDFALSCGYISLYDHGKLSAMTNEIGKLLSHMINNPQKYNAKGSVNNN